MKKFRKLSWVTPETRPWIMGLRPIKDATMRVLIKKGYWPFDQKRMGNFEHLSNCSCFDSNKLV